MNPNEYNQVLVNSCYKLTDIAHLPPKYNTYFTNILNVLNDSENLKVY